MLARTQNLTALVNTEKALFAEDVAELSEIFLAHARQHLFDDLFDILRFFDSGGHGVRPAERWDYFRALTPDPSPVQTGEGWRSRGEGPSLATLHLIPDSFIERDGFADISDPFELL